MYIKSKVGYPKIIKISHDGGRGYFFPGRSFRRRGSFEALGCHAGERLKLPVPPLAEPAATVIRTRSPSTGIQPPRNPLRASTTLSASFLRRASRIRRAHVPLMQSFDSDSDDDGI